MYIHLCKCACINWDIHMHLCVCASGVKTYCDAVSKPCNIHILLIEVLYSSPHPPSLPPGALRHRAEWSRAVCGDSDIHRMQWIINEHHLVHTTGEHSSTRWLQYVSRSFSLSLALPNTQSLTFGQFLSPVPLLFLSRFSHTYYHHTATVLLSVIISCFSPSTSLCPVCPPPPFPMLLSGLSDRRVMVSLILIQWYNSHTSNKVTCYPLKDIHFYDF